MGSVELSFYVRLFACVCALSLFVVVAVSFAGVWLFGSFGLFISFRFVFSPVWLSVCLFVSLFVCFFCCLLMCLFVSLCVFALLDLIVRVVLVACLFVRLLIYCFVMIGRSDVCLFV